MLSKGVVMVVVRRASQSSFRLPPVHFRHGQQHTPSSPQGVPVITSPVLHEHQGKQRHNNTPRKREERPHRKEMFTTKKSDKSSHSNYKNRAVMSRNSNTYKSMNNYNGKFSNEKKNRFITKNAKQSTEDNLRQLGVEVSGEVIYGIFPVFLALQAKRRKLHHLVYKDGQGVPNDKIQNILNIAEEQGIPTTCLKPSQFKKIFQGDQVHQGVCCDVSSLPFVTLKGHEEEIEQSEGNNSQQEAGRKRPELWLYLDQVQDPMNFGAVLRSAYFMGVGRVITSDDNSVKVTSTVSKASAGVAEIFPVHQVEDPVKLASFLAHAGWEVVSSASPGSDGDINTKLTNVTTFTPTGSVLLIVGNEGKGITRELQHLCHTVLTIEPSRNLHPHLHCLNVSVATALLLHSLRHRLDTMQIPDRMTSRP